MRFPQPLKEHRVEGDKAKKIMAEGVWHHQIEKQRQTGVVEKKRDLEAISLEDHEILDRDTKVRRSEIGKRSFQDSKSRASPTASLESLRLKTQDGTSYPPGSSRH